MDLGEDRWLDRSPFWLSVSGKTCFSEMSHLRSSFASCIFLGCPNQQELETRCPGPRNWQWTRVAHRTLSLSTFNTMSAASTQKRPRFWPMIQTAWRGCKKDKPLASSNCSRLIRRCPLRQTWRSLWRKDSPALAKVRSASAWLNLGRFTFRKVLNRNSS